MSVLQGNSEKMAAMAPSEAAKAAMEAGRFSDEQLAVIVQGLKLAQSQVKGSQGWMIFGMLEQAGQQGLGGLVTQLVEMDPDFGWVYQLKYAAKGGHDVYGRELLRQLWVGEKAAEWQYVVDVSSELNLAGAQRLLGWLKAQATEEQWIEKLGQQAWDEICGCAEEEVQEA